MDRDLHTTTTHPNGDRSNDGAPAAGLIIMGVAMIGVFGRVAYGVYRGRKHTDQAV